DIPHDVQQGPQEEEMHSQQAYDAGGIEHAEPAAKPVNRIDADNHAAKKHGNHKPVHDLFRDQEKAREGEQAEQERELKAAGICGLRWMLGGHREMEAVLAEA